MMELRPVCRRSERPTKVVRNVGNTRTPGVLQRTWFEPCLLCIYIHIYISKRIQMGDHATRGCIGTPSNDVYRFCVAVSLPTTASMFDARIGASFASINGGMTADVPLTSTFVPLALQAVRKVVVLTGGARPGLSTWLAILRTLAA